MYKCRHFAIQELVPPAIYELRGEKAWQLMDERLLYLIDVLRDEFGRATINNWSYGGDRKWSGLRTVTSPYYSPTSQHSLGRAVDILFTKPAKEVRESIIERPHYFLDSQVGINSITLEDSVAWFHVDVRNNHPGINLFQP